eukprot:2158630-Rhodomonas_salina.1
MRTGGLRLAQRGGRRAAQARHRHTQVLCKTAGGQARGRGSKFQGECMQLSETHRPLVPASDSMVANTGTWPPGTARKSERSSLSWSWPIRARVAWPCTPS